MPGLDRRGGRTASRHVGGMSGLELVWSRGGPGDTVPIVIVREHDDARAQDDLAGLLAADGCDAGVVVRA